MLSFLYLPRLPGFPSLALWIYWYVSNYILLTELEGSIATQMNLETTQIGTLIGGIILLIAISVGMSLIFIYLTRQMNLTRLYDNFIANVTHELKSPLSSIQLYLETMQKRRVPVEKQSEFLEIMLHDTRRLDTLITSILDVTGLEKKKLAYNFEVMQADAIINTLILEAASAFKISDKSLVVSGHLKGEIVLDQRAIKIIINNLFDNAVKYSRGPAKITIHLSNSEKYFLIDFTDQGIGVNKKDQKLIFNKFQRIYRTDSPSVKGSGMGLYWVSELIKSHGGHISVSSPGQEKGASFRIELPIYRTAKKRFTNRLLKFAGKKTNKDEQQDE